MNSSNNYKVNTVSQSGVDTSNWGVKQNMETSAASENTIFGLNRHASTQPRSKVVMNAAAGDDIGFSVSGEFAGSTKDDHFDDIVSASPKVNKTARRMGSKARTRMILAALDKDHEGSWGDVDRNYVIGGNWKSNGDMDFVNSFPKEVLAKAEFDEKKVEVVVAPTDLHLNAVQKELKDTHVHVSAQDVSQYGRGAYTGNITADQLTDMKIGWTLTGHSERRTLFGESDADVALKTKIAVENGLNVMLCIGEQLEERESGKTGEVNARQLQAVVDELTEGQWGNVVIAYEPVWAIGTGKVATPQQAQDTHAEIRAWLADAVSPEVAGATRILYGGSVNGANCADLIGNKDIDGFLVGGASLKPEFADIIAAAHNDQKK